MTGVGVLLESAGATGFGDGAIRAVGVGVGVVAMSLGGPSFARPAQSVGLVTVPLGISESDGVSVGETLGAAPGKTCLNRIIIWGG